MEGAMVARLANYSIRSEPFDGGLPSDPRNWSREDVADWLKLMTSKHHLGELKAERFLMNGKGLCLMTVDMYLERVPLGGKLLYKDFQIRLAKAMYQQSLF